MHYFCGTYMEFISCLIQTITPTGRKMTIGEEILASYPHLSFAQIHDAISYYFDHREEIEQDISSYVGELPNSHGRTSTDKSYVLHGMPYNGAGIGKRNR
ncbi:MAG: hypothetical protein LUQ65_03455 [Candidatus Helarchaeota archaeon]|nr:hypothetical protein [Candidatus Helarchaeota archaeon]